MSQIEMNFPRNTGYDGKQLRDKGIHQAEQHANEVHESWSDKAYNYLKWVLPQIDGEFMTEDIRLMSENLIPEPPSKRAWGAIMVRAVKDKLIRKVGFGQVKNPKAHRANASIWVKF